MDSSCRIKAPEFRALRPSSSAIRAAAFLVSELASHLQLQLEKPSNKAEWSHPRAAGVPPTRDTWQCLER